jgi:dihydrofolate reductase
MGKLIVSESLTLDGVFEGPAQIEAEPFDFAGWTAPYFDEEMIAHVGQNMSGGSTLLLGRVTYDQFQDSWTRQTGSFADYMNNVTKYVVSNTLKSADWNNSILLRGNAVEEVKKFKQSGADMAILGSGQLARSLMAHNLIDEYQLLIYPVAIGHGKRFFQGETQAKLRLREEKSFKSGVVQLVYVP